MKDEMKDEAQKREYLNIQISVLTENVETQNMSMVEKIFSHLKVKGDTQDHSELKVETSPEKVLQVIQQKIGKMTNLQNLLKKDRYSFSFYE